jgi:hypothetical protein
MCRRSRRYGRHAGYLELRRGFHDRRFPQMMAIRQNPALQGPTPVPTNNLPAPSAPVYSRDVSSSLDDDPPAYEKVELTSVREPANVDNNLERRYSMESLGNDPGYIYVFPRYSEC